MEKLAACRTAENQPHAHKVVPRPSSASGHAAPTPPGDSLTAKLELTPTENLSSSDTTFVGPEDDRNCRLAPSERPWFSLDLHHADFTLLTHH